jgi:hypothetical protein
LALPLSKALFDKGALHSYIKQEFVTEEKIHKISVPYEAAIGGRVSIITLSLVYSTVKIIKKA